MTNLQKLFFLLIPILSSSFIESSSNRILINVPYICQTPEGNLGRCISRDRNCYNRKSDYRTASDVQCPEGLGERPFVCCEIGTNIVFPDDGWTADLDDVPPHPSAVNDESKRKRTEILLPEENTVTPLPAAVNSESKNSTIPSINENQTQLRFNKPVVDMFPTLNDCGPTSVGSKIYNGREAELGEFPWLVNLEYRTIDNTLEIACAGSIINHRFVLTAAHCVTGKIQQDVGQLESLIAGVHNLKTDIDGNRRIKIERQIVHDNYHIDKKGRAMFDIALLTTNRPIVYSDTVAPICLPDAINPMPPLTVIQFTAAGWGADSLNSSRTDEKRIVNLPHISNEKCTLRVTSEQICAGGLDGKDTCQGDSGGSLCRLAGKNWFLEGIVSYGKACGTHLPSIYTKVRRFLPWIHENVDKN